MSDSFLHAYLIGFLYWTGVGLGCLGFSLLHNLTGGNWGEFLRRPLMIGRNTLWLSALLFIPIALQLPHLYHWAEPGLQDALLAKKAAYLNIPAFLSRTAVFYAVWLGFVALLQWKPETARKISGLGLVLFVLTVSFAGIDWIMTLEPHWFSSLFGAIFLINIGLTTLAFLIIVMALATPAEEYAARVDVFHDIGKLTFAFTLLWAYLNFSQYLLIWYANLPEETGYFHHRSHGFWGAVSIVMIVVHFFLPFLALLFRGTKRNPKALMAIAFVILAARFVNTLWLVKPAFHGVGFHGADLSIFAGLGLVWAGIFYKYMKGAPREA